MVVCDIYTFSWIIKCPLEFYIWWICINHTFYLSLFLFCNSINTRLIWSAWWCICNILKWMTSFFVGSFFPNSVFFRIYFRSFFSFFFFFGAPSVCCSEFVVVIFTSSCRLFSQIFFRCFRSCWVLMVMVFWLSVVFVFFFAGGYTTDPISPPWHGPRLSSVCAFII